MLTLQQRQQALRDELAAQKAEEHRKAVNAGNRRRYKRDKTKPWYELREAAKLKRKAIEERKAARLAKRQAKEEAKRKREEAHKRKFKDPVKDASRIYAQGFEDGKNWLIRSGEYVKRT